MDGPQATQEADGSPESGACVYVHGSRPRVHEPPVKLDGKLSELCLGKAWARATGVCRPNSPGKIGPKRDNPVFTRQSKRK
jgi:hypothetical protein